MPDSDKGSVTEMIFFSDVNPKNGEWLGDYMKKSKAVIHDDHPIGELLLIHRGPDELELTRVIDKVEWSSIILVRDTLVQFRDLTGRVYSAIASCSNKDVFSRRKGRQIAATKLLQELKEGGMEKEMRQTVFDTVCPEYRMAPSESDGEELNRLRKENVELRAQLDAFKGGPAEVASIHD